MRTITLIVEGSLAAIILYLILSHGPVAVQLTQAGTTGLVNYTKALQGR